MIKYIIIIAYILIINISGFIIMGYDKKNAIKEKRRVPEKRLFLIAFLGGAIGIYVGMEEFRHKTKHPKFIYGIPVVILLNLFLGYLLITNIIKAFQ